MGLPVAEVWHHHAHLAACLGENGWPLDGGKVAALVLDGTGLGPDGTIWGGEVLLGDYDGFRRAAWLQPAPLPGGDRAAREPWRNALARLDQAGLSGWADRLFAEKPCSLVRQAVQAGVNAPASSSAGRLFDAFAAVLGLCPDTQTYEGEAAMRLEAMARPGDAPLSFAVRDSVIDPAPIWPVVQDALVAGKPTEELAWRFHAGLARAFATAARRLVETGEARAVALSGGCFQNALLHSLVVAELAGIPVLTHRLVPANDGGLALGQALVAAARALSGVESR
jgi:hydrogenase maturation protein HypF